MNATVAREHVRVARALRDMPMTKELFRQGRFSYSKVRELTRLVGVVDEGPLCDLALEMTASQLARTVSSFRLAAGARIKALPERRLTTQQLDGGMVRLSVVLPAEDAALIDAAIEAAVRCASADPEPEALPADEPRATTPPDRVQALLDIAGTYLDRLPGEPADDHTLVVVHVNAEALDVPAGTSRRHRDDAAAAATSPSDVPAGTSLEAGTCFVEGQGAIEPATAERLLCTATVQGALVGRGGKVLQLGRTQRLASRAQRRAVKVRDRTVCQFPGCHQQRHLDAHHIVPWSHGGRTDLDNLILLCGRHHTLVHEGGLGILPTPGGSPARWEFRMPDGRRVDADGYHAWRDVVELTRALASNAAHCATAHPTRIFPTHGGAGFDLDECVRVLFDIVSTEPARAAA